MNNESLQNLLNTVRKVQGINTEFSQSFTDLVEYAIALEKRNEGLMKTVQQISAIVVSRSIDLDNQLELEEDDFEELEIRLAEAQLLRHEIHAAITDNAVRFKKQQEKTDGK